MSEISGDPVSLTTGEGVARITLARPERHNAFDDVLIKRLTELLEQVAAAPDIRVLVLTALGRSFCAGADLDWMRRCAGYSPAENTEDARRLGRMMAALDRLEKPTVALVQGAAYGGGVGLVAACDVAVADGKLSQEELRLLQMLRHMLELDRLHSAAIERGARVRHARL